jgi:hypothetical protein
MSFQRKIDFCGLADNANILCKSHDEGRSHSVATCENDEGDTIDTTVFGEVMSPSNEYALKGDLTNWSIVLGSVKTVEVNGTQKHFALKSVSIGTSNSGEVTLSASAEEVPTEEMQRTYTVVIDKLRARNKAQILNGLFRVEGTKAHLQSASYEIAAEFVAPTVDGDRVTADIYGASIKISVEAKQAGSEAPHVVPVGEDASVIVLSSPNSSSRPDSDYTPVSAEVTKYLTCDQT